MLEFVFVCVGNDDDLRQVVLGEDGAFAGMNPDAVLTDHTTASAKIARELAGTGRARAEFISSMPRFRAANPAPRTAR